MQRLLRQGATAFRCYRGGRSILTETLREPAEGLVKYLKEDIRFSGPVSVARYMRHALTHPVFGYYAHRDTVFGRSGDYVTAPEVSHLMGELAAVWYIMAWRSMGSPSSVQLVELGPGRATMLCDMLRAFECFQDFRQAVKSVSLVELSPKLRQTQLQTLIKTLGPHQNESLHVRCNENGWVENVNISGLDVTWVENITDIKSPCPTLLLAHEFFDALPVYKFQYKKDGWREILVDIDERHDGTKHFCYVLAPSPTPSLALLSASGVLGRGEYRLGDVVEISPDSAIYAQSIAYLLHKKTGAALIFDYGANGPSSASLRAIKNHCFVDLFENPGTCDLSANVDFSALSSFVQQKGYEGVACHGPATQGFFLRAMGIQERANALAVKYKTDPTKVAALKSGVERLTQPEQMGTLYKCMAITSGLKDVPVGFE